MNIKKWAENLLSKINSPQKSDAEKVAEIKTTLEQLIEIS